MAVLQEANNTVEKKNTFTGSHAAFAKLLAGNDKKVRDKGLKKLKKWISVRSLGDIDFTEDEFKKIWVGLFYSMWMSDMPLVQEDLADSLSSLVHCFNQNNDAALLFIKCFNITIATTWSTLDQYRIDKFSMLVRRFLRQSLMLLEKQNWPSELVKNLLKIYSEEVLAEKVCLGFKLQFIEIFLEEVAKVSKGKLPDAVVVAMIKPFAQVSALTRDGRVRGQLRSFFETLMKQTEVALQYEEKFQAWKEAGCPGGNPDLMTLESDEENMDDTSEFKDTPYESEQVNEIDDGPLDPRAGSVHVTLPQISLPFKRISSALQKAVKLPHATLKGKRMLLGLSKAFRKMDKGKYPLKMGKVKLEQKTSLKNLVDSSTQKSMKLEMKRQKKRKEMKMKLKKRKNIRTEIGESQTVCDESIHIDNGNTENNSKTKKKSPIKSNVKDLEKSEKISPAKKKSGDSISSVKKSGEKSLSPSKKSSNVFSVSEVPEEDEKSPLNTRKRKNSDWDDMELPPGWIVEPVELAQHKAKKPALGNWEVAQDLVEESKDTPKREEVAKNTSIVNLTPSPKKSSPQKISFQEPEVDEDQTSLTDNQTQSVKKSSPLKLSVEEPEKEANENITEEVEITVSPKKTSVSPPAFFAKAFAKAGITPKKPVSAPEVVTPIAKQVSDILNTSKSGRRISFNLAKNMAQEKEEWEEQVQKSPQIPFDAAKVPRHSALKAGLSPSPINPFYARKYKLTARYSLS